MSHHYSGPDFGFPHGDARLDLTDPYVFPKPGDPARSILVMDVHPSVSFNPRGLTPVEPFAPNALYEFKIDTNGDYVADIAYRVCFSMSEGVTQTATLSRVAGEKAVGTEGVGEVIVKNAPVSMGSDALVTEAGNYRFFAGWRSDPFFFDTNGAVNNLQFTGTDFFAQGDVCSIVLEVPSSALGSGEIGLWARTMDGSNGRWVQVDRGARPSQAVFLTGDKQGAYMAGDPVDDTRFVPVFAHSLEHTGGFMPEEATLVARSSLPDILRYDPKRPASYPDNGRALTDDVMDIFVSTITNGKVTRDNVGAHKDLLGEFPYLGRPHEIRLMESTAALV